MKFRNATLRDVAKQAHVSSSTVSRALKGDLRISSEVRANVCLIAEKMRYTPNLTARNLVSGRTGTIWIVSYELQSPNERYLARSLAKLFRDAGYQLLLLEQQDVWQYEQSLELLRHRLTDAAVMIAPFDCIESQFSNRIDRLPIPVVCFDRFWGNGHVPSVTTDNTQAVRALLERCVKANIQAVYSGFARKNSVSLERYQAAIKVAKELNLPFFDDPVQCSDFVHQNNIFRLGILSENESDSGSDAAIIAKLLPNIKLFGGIFDAITPVNRKLYSRVFIARQDFKRMADAAFGRIMLMLRGERVAPVRLQIPVLEVTEA